MDIWRLPRGVLCASGTCFAPTEAERRPKTSAALQRYKFGTPLLAAGSLIFGTEKCAESMN